jgi:hypothetical protein
MAYVMPGGSHLGRARCVVGSSIKKPVVPQAKAILNCRIDDAEHTNRCELLEADQYARSPYLMGKNPGDYSVFPHELTFRTVFTKPLGFGRTTDIHTTDVTVSSSFNNKSNNATFVFAGVAAAPAQLDAPDSHLRDNVVAIMVSGTQTVHNSGDRVIQPMDLLYWDEPAVQRQDSNPNAAPKPAFTLAEDGSKTKFRAAVYPLSFKDHGSVDMYRNITSALLGNLSPDVDGAGRYINAITMVIKMLTGDATGGVTHESLREEVRRGADGFQHVAADADDESDDDHKRPDPNEPSDGKHRSDEEVAAAFARKDETSQTLDAETIASYVSSEEVAALCMVYQVAGIRGSTMEILQGMREEQKKLKATYPKKTLEDIIRLQLLLLLERLHALHYQFYIDRIIGISLQTAGPGQAMDVFIRPGRLC